MIRRALTQSELLCVISVLCVLAALLFPAVQAARESARRVQCTNNLRQIALALHQYEDVHNVLPVYAFNNYSFHVYLLPFLEREALYQEFPLEINAMDYDGSLRSVRVPLYECPSDGGRFAMDGVELARGNYHGNAGSGAQRYGFNGVFGYGKHPLGTVYWLPLTAITDGLSQTAMVAEVTATTGPSTHPKRVIWALPGSVSADEFETFAGDCHFAPRSPSASMSSWTRGWSWLESASSPVVYNHVLAPNSLSCACLVQPKHSALTSQSFHPQAVNVAMADASVQTWNDSVELAVWRQLGSRDGHP